MKSPAERTVDVHGLLSSKQLTDRLQIDRASLTRMRKRSPQEAPQPIRVGDTDYYDPAQALRYFDSRPVPTRFRTPEEGDGATYGARLRKSLGESWERPPEQRPADPHDQNRPDRPAQLTQPARPTGQNRTPKNTAASGTHRILSFMRDLPVKAEHPESLLDFTALLLALLLLRRRGPWGRLHARAAEPGTTSPVLLEEIRIRTEQVLRQARYTMPVEFSFGSLKFLSCEELRDLMHAVEHAPADIVHEVITQYEALVRPQARHFFTPRGVAELGARLAVESHRGDPRSVYDPFLRGGEFPAALPAHFDVRGRAAVQATLPLVVLRLALLGAAPPSIRCSPLEPWRDRTDAPARADLVLTNPPFNTKVDRDTPHRRTGDWPYGPPPHEVATYAYLQHSIEQLKEGGRAVVVMPSKAGNSLNRAELGIRRNVLAAGVVEAAIALPDRLFTPTRVPVMLWLLRHPSDRCDRVIFLDAQHLGRQTGGRRVLEADDTLKILAAYRAASEGAEPELPCAVVDSASLSAADADPSLNPRDHIRPDVPKVTRASVRQRLIEVDLLTDRCWNADRLAHAHTQDNPHTLLVPLREAPRRSVRLHEICDIQAGTKPSRRYDRHSDEPLEVQAVYPHQLREGRVMPDDERLVSERLAELRRKYRLLGGDIVLARAGAARRPALVRPDQSGFLMSGNVTRIRCVETDLIVPEYLHLALDRDDMMDRIKDRAASTAVPSVSSEVLRSIEVALPPLPVQQRIVALLRAQDQQARAHRELAEKAAEARILMADHLLAPTR
ncbi:N-6 DNA methylase [Streptomyces sp. NPDC006510]|uniref:N-6 DNA methylase n=1 Tax=Streptomyces sp. NPDC006510 TaxID=3155600 RepID=UPI0033B279E8